MADSGHVFATPELENEVKNLRVKYRGLFDVLKRVPHLEIPIDVDITKIRHEAAKISVWSGYQVEDQYAQRNGYTKKQLEYYARMNQGRTLIEYKKDSFFIQETSSLTRNPSEVFYRDDGRLEYFKTELAEEMPATIETLYGFCDYLKQTRIMKIPPKYTIPWHTHHLPWEPNFPYFLGVLQIPIWCDDQCVYKVRSHADHELEFHCQYEPGKAYLFNSFFEHSVSNDSQSARISLFSQFHLEYEPILKKLEDWVNQYRGPLLPI